MCQLNFKKKNDAVYLGIENVSFRLLLRIHCSTDGHDLKPEKIETVCLFVCFLSVSMMKTYCTP